MEISAELCLDDIDALLLNGISNAVGKQVDVSYDGVSADGDNIAFPKALIQV